MILKHLRPVQTKIRLHNCELQHQLVHISQQAHNVETRSIQRWFNDMTLNQRWIGVVSALFARWAATNQRRENQPDPSKVITVLDRIHLTQNKTKNRTKHDKKKRWRGGRRDGGVWVKSILRILSMRNNDPVSILRKSISGRYRPVRVADGPMTARCRFT